jgi:hypothetical protein
MLHLPAPETSFLIQSLWPASHNASKVQPAALRTMVDCVPKRPINTPRVQCHVPSRSVAGIP